MSTTTGRRQYVEQGAAGSISMRLLADLSQEEVTISSTLNLSSLTIYGRGGSELVASTSITEVATSVATYSRTWTAATFPRLRGYRAVWVLSDDATTYTRTQYFEVVRRLFRSQLTDTDFTDRIPYISSHLPTGKTTFADYREDAWREIERRLVATFPEVRASYFSNSTRSTTSPFYYIDSAYPGNIFNPEDFFDAHRYLTLARFYEDIVIGGDGTSGEADKADRQRVRFEESFASAKSALAIDMDDDGIMDHAEREYNFASIERVR